jgi:hypothetical protein
MVCLDYNEKVFPIHIPSILHGGALVGMGSFWRVSCPDNTGYSKQTINQHNLLGYHGLLIMWEKRGRGREREREPLLNFQYLRDDFLVQASLQCKINSKVTAQCRNVNIWFLTSRQVLEWHLMWHARWHSSGDTFLHTCTSSFIDFSKKGLVSIFIESIQYVKRVCFSLLHGGSWNAWN